MKKLTTIIAAFVLFIGTQSFVIPGPSVSTTVEQAFNKQFSNAQNVTWEKTEGFYYGTFIFDGSEMNVAYSETGDLIGSSRQVKLANLPMQLSLKIREDYAGYGLSANVTEVVYGGDVIYYFTAQDNTKFLRLKANSEGNITVISKIKKQV